MTFSLILLTISWILINDNEKNLEKLKEKHLFFILNEKAKVLILNPKSLEFIDLLCNSPFERKEKEYYLKYLKEYLEDFNLEIKIVCLNKETYKIRNNCEKKVKNEIIEFPDYEIKLTICDLD